MGLDMTSDTWFWICAHSSSAPPPQYMQMSNMVSMGSMAPAQPQGTVAFAPHPSMMSVAPPAAPVPHKNEDDDEDYDS